MAAESSRPSLAELQSLVAAAGSVAAAARKLGVPRTTLSTWLHSDDTNVEAIDKRKLTDQVSKPGELTERDLKNPEELLDEYSLSPKEWEVCKVDVAARDAGTAKDPRIARTLSVTVAPKASVPKPALQGKQTTFKARPARKQKKNNCKTIVVLGDEQAPNGLDERLHELVCQFLADTQPDQVVHIGDLGDFESVSSYQQLNPGQWSNSVQECIDSSYRILGNYRASVPADTEFLYLIGNHEVRLQRYLLNQAKELFGLSRADTKDSVLDLAYLLRLDELGIQLVDTTADGNNIGTYPHPAVELVPNKLIAIHGDVARRRSGTSPHAQTENASYGVIHGHTHRAAVVSRTVRSPRKSYQLQSCEIGCLCKSNGLGYTSSPDWQQGFAVVNAWSDGHYEISLASYQNGVLVHNGRRWQ